MIQIKALLSHREEIKLASRSIGTRVSIVRIVLAFVVCAFHLFFKEDIKRNVCLKRLPVTDTRVLCI